MGWTILSEQKLYLFDIVASLCAGFNEHDIQFLSSLLALFRGDLSAQATAERWRNGGIDRHERGQAERERGRWRENEELRVFG